VTVSKGTLTSSTACDGKADADGGSITLSLSP
jgi:hypothetical protein